MRGKVSHGVLLLHDNAPIQQVGFIELNHCAYSLDIASTNYCPLSNLKKFLHDKNLSSDDEAVTTVDHYLTDLNSEFFCKGPQSLHDP